LETYVVSVRVFLKQNNMIQKKSKCGPKEFAFVQGRILVMKPKGASLGGKQRILVIDKNTKDV